MIRSFVLLGALWSLCLCTYVGADDERASAMPPPVDRLVDFVDDVQPILRATCYSCHGEDGEEGGLRLDIGHRALEGGDTGKSILPGNSAESRLVHVVAGLDDELGMMPPEGDGTPLSDRQIGLLRAWIDQGATWPEAETGQRGSDHWSFLPIVRPPVPPIANGAVVYSPIDAFVQARLQTEGWTPAAEADRSTLIRRLYLDLLGLPPTPAEVRGFLEDTHPDAYERLVDRLLASPHLGERWGRHWLDLARYADSDGYEKDKPRPFAWRYRDWVISALNADMPFARFTCEQIAGDLLPQSGSAQKTATGFHRNTLHNTEGGVDREEDRVKKTVDRTNTVGTIWLGLTVGCAQCHSHKYDPLTQREYYALYGFFNSIKEADIDAPSPLAVSEKPKAQAVVEIAEPRTTRVHIRGDFLTPGDPVAVTTPSFLPALAARDERPNRLDLAAWLVSPDNPLVARVTANRVWAHFFGRGIVRTVDDFGQQGDAPTHPELLDWLASEFRSHWSLKRLQRQIVTSAVYRQSSAVRPELQSEDPENELLARQTRRRVEAEIIRDLALAASGLLESRVGGPSVRPPQPSTHSQLTYANSAKWQVSAAGDAYRRGLYTFFQRTSPYPMLITFDCPDSNVCVPERNLSNTPLQALTLWNDAVFFECAQALGRRLVDDVGCAGDAKETVHKRTRRAFQLAVARDPTPDEERDLVELYDAFREMVQRDAASSAITGDVPPPDRVAGDELAAWILVGRTMINLDEFITRE